MERDRFEALIERMERFAIKHPAQYRRRVYGMAALGYAYLFFVVVVLLALLATAVVSLVYLKGLALKLAIVVGALFVAVMRSLWVKHPPPEGEAVSAAEAPALFEVIHEMQRRLQTPAIHSVLVTTDFNAAVTQVPRLGVFGWHRNFLLLGLPLMKGLTVEQFKAVVGHELGHLSHGHARIANWIYRMRMIWQRLEATFERKSQWGSGLILRFFKWYIPYFNAISFPFARANEYEADAASVRLTSSRDAAQALTNIHIISSYLAQSYWPGLRATAKDVPEPPFKPYSGFVAQAVIDVPKSDLERWHNAAVSESTAHVDTHPSLSDRLRAIGEAPTFAPPLERQGADQLLGSALGRIEDTFDRRWRERISGSWQEFHKETQVKKARLLELRSEAGRGALDEEASLEMAGLEEAVGTGAGAALPLLRDTVARFPDSVLARYSLARNLLQQSQEEGVGIIEAVIAQDASALLTASELLSEYYLQRNDPANAKHWRRRYVDEAVRLQGAKLERQQIRLSDLFAPNVLDSEARSKLTAELKQIKKIKRAYLVRKIHPTFLGEPFYILGVHCTGLLQLHSKERTAQAIAEIRQRVTFPGAAVIIKIDGNSYRFARKMRRVKGARLV